jgi:hypothetical protein
MSQRDVLAELRTARVEAPPALRARVRLVAAQAPAPRRSRRRFALVLVPVVAAAVAAGAYFSTRPSGQPNVQHGEISTFSAKRSAGTFAAPTPAPSEKRVQRYGATLDVEVKDVGDAVARAQRIAASLGGFTSSLHLSTAKRHGHADLVLRVPRRNVQKAVARLRVLGAVTGEQVDIQDLQAGIDTTDRTIARLQRELKALRAQTQTDTVKREIASLTARVVALQRQRAATLQAAHFATVRLALSTPPVPPAKHHHYVHDALPWFGGAAAVLVLLLVLRWIARLREARLLSRS